MASNLFDLTGKVGLVTGANRGIGLGYATGMAKGGADVVIWGRDMARNEDAAAALREHGGRVLAQSVDVSDSGQVRRAMDEAVEAMGRIDCCVASAGISTRLPAFHEMTDAMYHELLAINLHGATYTLREAVRHMVARAEAGDPGGSLITCGSLSAVRGVARLEHYAAAKGALASITFGLAAEYGGRGIRANMVSPGYFETGLGGRDDEVVVARAEQMRNRNPIPRPGYPEDLEGIIIYLMSDASAYHTGDVITIDGGMSTAL